jgi:hypothetical protein
MGKTQMVFLHLATVGFLSTRGQLLLLFEWTLRSAAAVSLAQVVKV